MIMNVTREEFKTMLLLYASGIDAQVHDDELEVILQHVDGDIYQRVKKMYGKMSDVEVLDCIKTHCALYAATEADRQGIFDALHAVIAADGEHSAMENHLMRTLRKLLR